MSVATKTPFGLWFGPCLLTIIATQKNTMNTTLNKNDADGLVWAVLVQWSLNMADEMHKEITFAVTKSLPKRKSQLRQASTQTVDSDYPSTTISYLLERAKRMWKYWPSHTSANIEMLSHVPPNFFFIFFVSIINGAAYQLMLSANG